MSELGTTLTVAATFLIAGAVKGVIGLGLPTVSLALLTMAFDLPTAMALLLAPSFVTNLWQSLVGGHAKAILLRLWPFLVTATLTVSIGAAALTRVDFSLLTALLGALLITYSAVNLVGLRFTVSRRHEVWAGALAGSMNGILTGMTGSFVMPGVMFLQALQLSRDVFIQAMGMLFTLSTVALAAALHNANFLTVQHGILSFAAVLPAIAGMIVGQHIRRNLSEQVFRRAFFAALLVLGAYIVVGALTSK